jgi:hypothetical protein
MTVLRKAVLVTGLYGAGKSSLVAEMAERLERADLSYGAIDVDWLAWYHLPSTDAPPAGDLRSMNLAYVADRYLAAGVNRLILAEAAMTDDDVGALKRLIPCPVAVVRLDVGIDTIEQRLGVDPTIGRLADLDVARDWAARGAGRVTADLILDGAAPLAANAGRVLSWLGWQPVGAD